MRLIALTFFIYCLTCYYTTFASTQQVGFELEEEEFVQDIPFETSDVVLSLIHESDTSDPTMDNTENPISDGEELAYYLSSNVEFTMEEEEYIDDIPFDTEKLVDSMVNFKAGDKNVLVQEFYLADEEYIDDIPFDTKQLIADRMSYPEFARDTNLEGTVCVCCKYDENGFLKVVACNCSDKSLRDYVVTVLEDIRLRSGIVSLDKEYVLKFDFKSM